jgi:sugar phosphate isomerase/epimerase
MRQRARPDPTLIRRDTFALVVVVSTCFTAMAISGWVIEHAMTWNQVDTLSVVLSALSAILTALGIGIAVIAIWGYNSIKDEAARKAAEIAREVAKAVAEEKAEQVAARTVTSMEGSGSQSTDDYGEAAGKS